MVEKRGWCRGSSEEASTDATGATVGSEAGVSKCHQAHRDADTGEEWDRKNARRIELAKRKARNQLTAEEEVEFEALQEAFFAYIGTKFPRQFPDGGRLEELENKLQAAGDGTEPS